MLDYKKKLTPKMGTYYSLTTIMASNLDFTNQVLLNLQQQYFLWVAALTSSYCKLLSPTSREDNYKHDDLAAFHLQTHGRILSPLEWIKQVPCKHTHLVEGLTTLGIAPSILLTKTLSHF